MQPLRCAAAAMLVCGCLAGSAGAQPAISAAALSGRVLDRTGATIAGAEVVVSNVQQNRRWQTRADAHGRFQFLSLPVGSYELSASAAGFTVRTVRVTLTVGQAADLVVSLDVAGLAAQVDVSGDAPALHERRTQIAETIRPDEVDSLPLNGRNFLDLALLAPGVSRTVQRNTERFAETSAVPGTGISVAGQRNLNNTFVVDGLSANDDAAGLAGTYFAEDVIREFQVITSGGIAEFGRASAGIVNIVTQSGGNAAHGRAYGFFRDDRLDARNPLAARKDPLNQAQYGLTFGGPVVKDRLFWFGNVERTDLSRTGVITISPAAVSAINRTLDETGYRGPRVATGAFGTGYDTTNVFGRLDGNVSETSRLSARYSLYDVASANARSVGGLNAQSRGTRLDNRDQTIAVDVQTSTSSASFNELRGQFTRSRLSAPPNDAIGPAVTISGVASFGTSTASPTARALDVAELADSYTMQRGDHLVKLGGSVLYERLDVAFPGALQGAYTYGTLADFVSGRYINYQQAFGEPAQFQANPNLGVFVQDEWRPWRALTVNAGLRYDLQGLERPVETDTNNLSPRVGIAYAPGDGRLVIRASGGLYFDRIPLRAVSNALQRDGERYKVALVSFGQAGAPVFPATMRAYPAGVVTGVTSIDPRIQSGVSRQSNLQIERQIGSALSASIGYLHLRGDHIIMSRNVNPPALSVDDARARGIANLGRPDPRVANNSQYQSIGVSAYDGLTLAVESRRSSLGTFRVSYTLSKALDDAGNAFFSSPQNNADPLDDYGLSDNDERHHLVVSGAAPDWHGLRVAYVFSYASAPPFNVQTGADRNGDTTVNDRPAGVGRNTGRGFDSATLDLRVSRAFSLGGAHRLEVIADGFNVLNRSNFLIPNNISGTGPAPLPSFGRPTAAADPRQFQIGIRWMF